MIWKTLTSGALLFVALSGINVFAEESKDKQVKALKERVSLLEERINKMERFLLMKEGEKRSLHFSSDLQDRIKKRFERDQTTYNKDQLMEIERLYQVANKQWNSQEAQQSLKKLVDKYPKANRTGCAILYLGQMSAGEEMEKYLKQAINSFGDCYYGDGVQVGAYARLQLANYFIKSGKQNDAMVLFEEIRKDYPDAIDHNGRLLKEIISK